MRILHAPVNVANQAWLLGEAMRRAGHDAQMWTFDESPFGYPSGRIVARPTNPREALKLVDEMLEAQFDVIHLHFARSLIPPRLGLPPMWDVDALIAAGARLVHSFHGTDIRRPQFEKDLDPWSYLHFGAAARVEDSIAADLAQIRPRAHAMTVSNASMAVHAPGSVHLPLAIDTAALPPATSPDHVVIVHAPSIRATKGTDFIVEALARLTQLRPEVEIDLVEGVSNDETLVRMARASIVVEKVLGDGYGMTCVEAMALGKPVVTRATARTTDASPGFPGVSADPSDLLEVLVRLVDDDKLRARLGAEGKRYVATVHSLTSAVPRLMALYDPLRPLGIADDDFGDAGAALARTQARAGVLARQNNALTEALATERARSLRGRVRAFSARDGVLPGAVRRTARLFRRGRVR